MPEAATRATPNYPRSFASIVISAFNSFEIGQPRFASAAAVLAGGDASQRAPRAARSIAPAAGIESIFTVSPAPVTLDPVVAATILCPMARYPPRMPIWRFGPGAGGPGIGPAVPAVIAR